MTTSTVADNAAAWRNRAIARGCTGAVLVATTIAWSNVTGPSMGDLGGYFILLGVTLCGVGSYADYWMRGKSPIWRQLRDVSTPRQVNQITRSLLRNRLLDPEVLVDRIQAVVNYTAAQRLMLQRGRNIIFGLVALVYVAFLDDPLKFLFGALGVVFIALPFVQGYLWGRALRNAHTLGFTPTLTPIKTS